MRYSLFTLVAVIVGCSPMRTLRKLQPLAKVDYTEDELNARKKIAKEDTTRVDTAKRTISYTRGDGTTAFVTDAVFDSVSNSSISMIYIPQVTISARSMQRVAERNGKIHINFLMIVPSELQRTSWQVNLQPMMSRDDGQIDSLEAVLLTGTRFRAQQNKDYAQYNKYLQQIIPDSADFFSSYVHHRAFYSYTQGLERRRKYLQEKLQKQYKSKNQLLMERFKMFNRLNLHKDSVYENNIIEQQQLILSRKKKTYLDAVDNTTSTKSQLAYRQERMSQMDFDKLKVRSLYRLGDWSPFSHYSFTRNVNKAALRDSLNRIARKQKLEGLLNELGQIDSADIVKRFINHKKVALNKQRSENKGRVFNKMVPHPFRDELRLDSVVNLKDTLRYFYSQEVQADENTSKLNIYLNGSIVKHNGLFYQFSSPDTLHFNVSSMTSFIDEEPRYVQRIITRDAEANARFSIEFPKNKTFLNEQYGSNSKEMKKVKEVIAKLMSDPIYIIDSIRVTAASSPEGNLSINKRLSQERSMAFSQFMKQELKYWRDSLDVQSSVVLNEDGTSTIHKAEGVLPDLDSKIRIESIAEDWDKLSQLISLNDSMLNKGDNILEMITNIANPDKREIAIRRAYPADYATMRAELYPKLRAVDVKFNLLRRGMQQDTVYTTELDTAYAEGVRLLKARKYTAAIEILRRYEDVNTALAYMSLGYDDAALRIFLEQKPTDNILYTTAIIYARKGDDASAVQQLMRAVEMAPRLRFRANLDPELAVLIKRYNLFADE